MSGSTVNRWNLVLEPPCDAFPACSPLQARGPAPKVTVQGSQTNPEVRPVSLAGPRRRPRALIHIDGFMQPPLEVIMTNYKRMKLGGVGGGRAECWFTLKGEMYNLRPFCRTALTHADRWLLPTPKQSVWGLKGHMHYGSHH